MKQLLIALIFLSSGLKAQYSSVSSFQSVSNSNGTLDYCIGQTFYSEAQSASGSVSAGLQISLELDSSSRDTINTSLNEIQVSFNIYPNPTQDFLIISTKNQLIEGLQYTLYDLSSRVVRTDYLQKNQTRISFMGLPSATYFLEIGDAKSKNIIKVVKQ